MTLKQLRISHGKRDVGVRVIEVLLYTETEWVFIIPFDRLMNVKDGVFNDWSLWKATDSKGYAHVGSKLFL